MSTNAPISIKRNNYHNNPKDFCIYTPLEISYFIKEIIPNSLGSNILDICCGDGNLSEPWSKNNVIGLDIVDRNFSHVGKFYKGDFLEQPVKVEIGKDRKTGRVVHKKYPCDLFVPEEVKSFKPDLILSNPPFNGHTERKLFPYELMKKSFDLYGIETPLVLFTLMGLRLNWRYGAKREKELDSMFQNGLKLSSIITCPIDAFFPGNKDKGQQWEILIFNVKNIEPHYYFSSRIRKEIIEKYRLS